MTHLFSWLHCMLDWNTSFQNHHNRPILLELVLFHQFNHHKIINLFYCYFNIIILIKQLLLMTKFVCLLLYRLVFFMQLLINPINNLFIQNYLIMIIQWLSFKTNHLYYHIIKIFNHSLQSSIMKHLIIARLWPLINIILHLNFLLFHRYNTRILDFH